MGEEKLAKVEDNQMKIDTIPEAFQTKLRVAVMAALFSQTKDFNSLKAITSSSDGNLSVQLSKLEQYGYLNANKSFQNKKSHTEYEITEEGRKAFQEYVTMLSSIVRSGEINDRKKQK